MEEKSEITPLDPLKNLSPRTKSLVKRHQGRSLTNHAAKQIIESALYDLETKEERSKEQNSSTSSQPRQLSPQPKNKKNEKKAA